MTPCESCPFLGCPGCAFQGGAEPLSGAAEGEGLKTAPEAVRSAHSAAYCPWCGESDPFADHYCAEREHWLDVEDSEFDPDPTEETHP